MILLQKVKQMYFYIINRDIFMIIQVKYFYDFYPQYFRDPNA